jgi:hypothetical protein
MRARLLLPALAAILLAAPVAARQSADDLAVRNFKLSMAVVQKLDAVHRALAAAVARDPRGAQLRKLRAELEALEAKDEPTEAEQKRMETLAGEIERLEESLAGGVDFSEANSLSEMSRMIEASPLLAGAVRQGGITPREFATAHLALIQSLLTHQLMKSTGTREVPKDASADNIKFIADHEAELSTILESWEKLGKGS